MDKEIISQLLLVLIPVLSAAAAFIIAWLRVKTRELNKKIEKEEIEHNLELLDRIVLEVAKTIKHSLVSELERKQAGRQLSLKDMELIKLEALKHTYSILDESMILILKRATNDLDCLICSKIESTLYELKKYDEEKERQDN